MNPFSYCEAFGNFSSPIPLPGKTLTLDAVILSESQKPFHMEMTNIMYSIARIFTILLAFIIISACNAHDSTAARNKAATESGTTTSQQQSATQQSVTQQAPSGNPDTSKLIGLWGAKSFDFPNIEFDPLEVEDGVFYMNIRSGQNSELALSIYTAYFSADCLTPQNTRRLQPSGNNQYADGTSAGVKLTNNFGSLEAILNLDGDLTIVNLKRVVHITAQDLHFCSG